jgi:hypothetical protein
LSDERRESAFPARRGQVAAKEAAGGIFPFIVLVLLLVLVLSAGRFRNGRENE